MRVLITGAAGMYGVHLTRQVLAGGPDTSVVAVDNFSRRYPGGEPLSSIADGDDRLQIVRADFAQLGSAELDDYGPDVVVHYAARISVPESMDEPAGYFANNEAGTFHFAHAVAGMRRPPLLVYASSPEVYGAPVQVPMNEDHPLRPKTVYAVTKLAAEMHCMALHRWWGHPVVVIRNFNTYGPHQNLEGYPAVMPAFIKLALAGEPLRLEGGGEQTRDFVFVEDAVQAYALVLAKGADLAGSIFNIGTGVQTSIRALAETVLRVTGSTSKLIVSEGRRSDLPALSADIGRIQTTLDWAPQVTLEDGIRRLADWLRRVNA